MKLKDLPNNMMFVKLSGNNEPLYHKGQIDGVVRAVVGPNGGWNAMVTRDLDPEKAKEFFPGLEVQPVIISFPMPCGD